MSARDMLIDIPAAEDVLTLREVARRLRVNRETVLGYMARGVRGACGKMIRLEMSKFSGKWLTTASRVEAWLQALASPEPPEFPPPPAAVPDQRVKERAAKATANVMGRLRRNGSGRR